MRNRLPLLICAFIMTLCAGMAARAQDLKIVTRSSVNGQPVSESTTYIKGPRNRMEQKVSAQPGMDENMARMMPSIAQVYQCDRRRLLQVNDRAKKYSVSMLDEEGSVISDQSAGDEQSNGSSGGPRRGAVVQYNMTITDTGQRQDMFGFKARYLKLVSDVIPSPGACTPKSHYEQEGWFIDLQAETFCASRKEAAPVQAQTRPGCQDTFRYKIAGTGKMGFPLNVTTTMTDENGRRMAVKQEVVELKTAPLSAALFDVPAGYTEAKSSQELYGTPSPAEMAAMMSGRSNGASSAREESGADVDGGAASNGAKRPGVVRIGVVALNDRSGRLSSEVAASLRQRLIDDLDGSDLDAVSLDANAPDAVQAEARQKQCDFILYTDIAALKPASKAGKVGGMFGRAAGIGSGGADKSEARVEFRLVPATSATPQLQSNATAREEGDEASVSAALTQEAARVSAEARRKL